MKNEKKELFKQFVDVVNRHEFDYDSFQEVSYWLDQFTDGKSDDDLHYLNNVINLMKHENPLVFAYFEKAIEQKYSFVNKIHLNSSASNECLHLIIYKSMMDDKVINYVFKDPLGAETRKKINIILRIDK